MSIRAAAAPFLRELAERAASRRRTPDSRVEDQVTAWFDRFRVPLFRYLSAFRLDRADVEEIIQEVFLALFQRLNGGAPVDNVPGWLFGAAHNLGLRQSNRLRKAWESEQPAKDREVADGAPNPEDLYADCELSTRLHRIVDSLPEMDRRCILLRSEGLRYREIAAILDISLGGVALSLSRSLARIARCAERCNR